VLADLKRYSFSGYVRTVLEGEGGRAVGFVIVVEGTPELAIHHTRGQTKAGKVALKSVWEDSYGGSCEMEIHAKVDLDEIRGSFPNAGIERVRKEAKMLPREPAPAERRTERAHALALREQLRAWRDAGYMVDGLTATLESSEGDPTKALAEYEDAVTLMEPLRKELDGMSEASLDGEIGALREKARDPTTHAEVARSVTRLRDEIERLRKPRFAPMDEGRELHLQDRARQVFEMIVRHRQAAGKSADISETDVAKALEGKAPTRDERTSLIRQYTFDTYIVGPSNRFAHAAALAVAKSPHNAYNPLFITSGSGLGKTHLLNAIGDSILRENPQARVVYVTAEGFSNEFHEAMSMSMSRLNEFRAKYRGADVALLDDAHFLSGKGDVQEELFHTFNDLYNANKQIVLTSDRPPKEIPDLEDRLVSRFESGLIADIQRPEFETRLAILKRKVRDAGGDVDEEVLTYIARRVESNIRELGGALNRVIAFSNLMDQPVSLDLAKEVLKDLAGSAEAGARAAARDIRPGHSYLIEEDRPEQAFRLFDVSAGAGRSLLVTRSNPRRVREKHDLRADRILWLTERESGSVETIPPSLERIVYVMEEFMKEAQRGAIMLDGIEYLVSSNSFDSVLKFLRRLVDHTSESQFTLLVTISTKTMKEQEIKNLEREMEVVSF
jgi:chromosomal replication initiator protein DnaA